MAETFEATWIGPGGLNQRVCLKCVLPSLCGERQFVRLFEREVRLAAQLRHPGIVAMGQKIRRAGIKLSVTVIIGLAGTERSRIHAEESGRAPKSE